MRQPPDDLPMPPTAAELVGQRILLIVDNAANMALLAQIIRSQGHQPLQAASGRRGLDLVGEEPPDLIVLDIRAAGMSALDFVETLRADDETGGIPIVVLAKDAPQGAEEVRIEGGEIYASDPTALKAFGDLVNLLLRRGRYGKGR